MNESIIGLLNEGSYEKVKALYGNECFLNDKGVPCSINQQFLAGLFKELYKPVYEESEHSFFMYNEDNGLWEKITEPTIMNMVATMMKSFADWKENSLINQKRTAGIAKDVIRFLQGICKERNAFEKSEQNIIHCGNGVLRFNNEREEWELSPFSPEYRSRNRTKYKYDKEAKCDKFLSQLVCPAMSESDVQLLQYYIGQCLLGVNLSQTFVMLTGTAGGGKSTLVNVIENLIGRHNCTELRLEHMGSRFELQRLVGKTLLTAKDVHSSFLNTSGAFKLKALTGNDTMSIEAKGSNDVADIRCAFNAIITSNSTLRISTDGDTQAWKRRMLWIRYENPPPGKPIVDFDKLLLSEEGSGILNWALEGAKMLLKAKGRIFRAQEQANRIDSLLLESNSIHHFIDACIIPEKGGNVTVAEIIESFQEFCTTRGWQMLPERHIQSRLADYMLMKFGASKRTDIKRNGKSQRGFANFTIKTISQAAS